MLWLVPLMPLNLGLVAPGVYPATRAVVKIHHHDRWLDKLKSKHSRPAELLD